MGRPKKIISNKHCPRCGTQHTKPGLFCSRSCANVREHSDLDKINKSISVAAYYKTEAAETHKWKLSHIANAARLIKNDSTVEMPTEEDMGEPIAPDYYEEDLRSKRSGRDIWFDCD